MVAKKVEIPDFLKSILVDTEENKLKIKVLAKAGKFKTPMDLIRQKMVGFQDADYIIKTEGKTSKDLSEDATRVFEEQEKIGKMSPQETQEFDSLRQTLIRESNRKKIEEQIEEIDKRKIATNERLFKKLEEREPEVKREQEENRIKREKEIEKSIHLADEETMQKNEYVALLDLQLQKVRDKIIQSSKEAKIISDGCEQRMAEYSKGGDIFEQTKEKNDNLEKQSQKINKKQQEEQEPEKEQKNENKIDFKGTEQLKEKQNKNGLTDLEIVKNLNKKNIEKEILEKSSRSVQQQNIMINKNNPNLSR